MKSFRTVIFLLLAAFSLIVVGCQSNATDNAGGTTSAGVAVNPAMSAKQKAIIQQHHKDN